MKIDMTYIEQAIKEAVEKGGWKDDVLSLANCEFEISKLTRPQGDTVGIWFRWVAREGHAIREKSLEMLLGEITSDPAFWQALGRARGWKEEEAMGGLWRPGEVESVVVGLFNRNTPSHHAHMFFDWILAGSNAESFFKSLYEK